MNKNINAAIGMIVGLLMIGFFVAAYLYATSFHYNTNYLNYLSWLVIIITAGYWILIVKNKKTSNQATEVVKNISQNSVRLIKWDVKWNIIVILLLIIFLVFLFILKII